MAIEADAATIDLARPEVDQFQRPFGNSTVAYGLPERLKRVHGVGNDECWVVRSGLHHASLSHHTGFDRPCPDDERGAPRSTPLIGYAGKAPGRYEAVPGLAFAR